MKNVVTYLSLIIVTSIFWWWWCHRPTACNPCNDPQLVKVIPNQSLIRYNWEFIQGVHHNYNGTSTSSISIIPAGTTTINSVSNDSVTTSINLVATDTTSGIKCISIQGGFGLTCFTPGGAIVLDGILPVQEQCNELTKCCLRTEHISANEIDNYINCGKDRVLSNGSVGLTGIIKSCGGKIDTVRLNVSFH